MKKDKLSYYCNAYSVPRGRKDIKITKFKNEYGDIDFDIKHTNTKYTRMFEILHRKLESDEIQCITGNPNFIGRAGTKYVEIILKIDEWEKYDIQLFKTYEDVLEI